MDKQSFTRKRRRSNSSAAVPVHVESANEAKVREATRIAKQALTLVKKQQRAKEVKIHDISYSTGVSSTAGIVELTSGATRRIVQGIGYDQRIGDDIYLKKIYLNFTIVWNATPTTQQFKIALVRGYNEDNTAINTNDCYQNNSIESLRTYHDRRKVDVLWVKTYTHNRDTGVASNKSHVEMVKALNFKTTYTSNGVDPENGHLYLYLLSDQSADVPVVNLAGRVFFTDS